ncbi:hypothetical protein D7X55_04440 [Corallococcus sp. AB049A]|nr:hypothetical protein D7X55_04440 [Corallococcus sp. AB049A]
MARGRGSGEALAQEVAGVRPRHDPGLGWTGHPKDSARPRSLCAGGRAWGAASNADGRSLPGLPRRARG